MLRVCGLVSSTSSELWLPAPGNGESILCNAGKMRSCFGLRLVNRFLSYRGMFPRVSFRSGLSSRVEGRFHANSPPLCHSPSFLLCSCVELRKQNTWRVIWARQGIKRCHREVLAALSEFGGFLPDVSLAN